MINKLIIRGEKNAEKGKPSEKGGRKVAGLR